MPTRMQDHASCWTAHRMPNVKVFCTVGLLALSASCVQFTAWARASLGSPGISGRSLRNAFPEGQKSCTLRTIQLPPRWLTYRSNSERRALLLTRRYQDFE
jgi:hypothetical protein